VAAVKKLNNPQQQIYDFILRYSRENAYPPSVREICDAVGLFSPATVHTHLKNMEAAGLIRRDHSKRRSIYIIPQEQEHSTTTPDSRVPLVGRVAAGTPILASENVEGTFPIPELLTHGNRHDGVFLLRVEGDSMIDAGINDGDYIVVDPELGYVSGDIVVVRTAEETATVKRIYPEGETVRLQPENELYSPIYLPAAEVEVVGKVTGLMRRI
jgi:repressor LexA